MRIAALLLVSLAIASAETKKKGLPGLTPAKKSGASIEVAKLRSELYKASCSKKLYASSTVCESRKFFEGLKGKSAEEKKAALDEVCRASVCAATLLLFMPWIPKS
jgi:hypothetical protein